MTSERPVRRVLARFCSPATMSRVVDPTLADIGFERGRPAWLGYLALVRALALHAVCSVPGTAARIYSEDGCAIPRLAACSIAGALVAAVPFVAVNVTGVMLHGGAFTVFGLLLPQALPLSVPAGLLLAFPIALRDRLHHQRVMRRALALSVFGAMLTGAIAVGVMPEANQAYRVRISGNQNVERGPNESGLRALRQQIDNERQFHGDTRLVRHLEYMYHVRLAVSAAPLPFGLFAIGLAGTRFGRRRPWSAGLIGIAVYLSVYYPILERAEMLALSSSLPAAALGWVPTLAIAIAGLLGYARAGVRLTRAA